MAGTPLVPKIRNLKVAGEGSYTTLNVGDGDGGDYTGTPYIFSRLKVTDRFQPPVGADKFDTISSSDVRYNNNTDIGGASAYDIFDIYDTYWLAQTFTVNEAYRVTRINLPLSRFGSPGTITVSLRTAVSGLPTGSDLTSGTTDGDTLPESTTTWEWRSIDITDYNLTAGDYAIVVRATGGDASNYLHWWGRFFGTFYSGNAAASTTSGAVWQKDIPEVWPGAGGDTAFELWGEGGAEGEVGFLWIEQESLHHIDEFGDEQTNLNQADVDDTPVDGATTVPVSSNWAYDHQVIGQHSEILLTPKASSTGAEGTVFYKSDDDHLWVGTE